MRIVVLPVALACLTLSGAAQNESRFQSDLRREGEALKSCGQIAKIADCGQTLVLGQPLHIAVGISPLITDSVPDLRSSNTRISPTNGGPTSASTLWPP